MMFRVVFWDILPCKMIADRRFRGAYCLHHQGCRVYWLAICSSSDCSYTVPDDEINELETCRTLNINIMVYPTEIPW
jgi:hypothetical protein